MLSLPVPTPEAQALRQAILAVPRTEEPMYGNFPAEITPEDLERLHAETMAGTDRVIPELRKLIARHPGVPTFYNYLKCAYQIRRQTRQANQVDDETIARFPDYLFSRLALAARAEARNDDPAAAFTHLGPALSLPALYPAREVFHVSEILNYYHHVGIYQLRNNRLDLAYGVLAALREIRDDHPACPDLEQAIVTHNIAAFRRRTERDRMIRITVDIPPRSLQSAPVAVPEFHHAELADLYEYGADLPDSRIQALLVLPRETLVADLCRVLEYETARSAAGPELGRADDSWAPVHALCLLGELGAAEAIDTVLGFLGIDPADLDFHLGDFGFNEAFAGIFGDSFARLGEWLKSPGIGSRAKGIVSGAITRQARRNPQLRAAASAVIGDIIAFMLAAKPADNVIDTMTLSNLVVDAIQLRATQLQSLIIQAWERDLLEEMIVGDLASILADLAAPPEPPPPVWSLHDCYAELRAWSAGDSDEDDGDFEADEDADPPQWMPSALRAGGHASLYSPPDLEPAPAPTVGRNEPCPCGSGKKYKKCCMK
jgi:hypothetical protein